MSTPSGTRSNSELSGIRDENLLLEANLEKKIALDESYSNPVTDDEDEISAMPGLTRSDSAASITFIDLSKLLLLSDFDFGMGVSDSTKKKFNEMKTKTKQTFKKFADDTMRGKQPSRASTARRARDFNRLQERFLGRLTKFDERIHQNLVSSATEKLFYALAVFLIAAAGFIIGKYPTYFHVFHSVVFCVLMPIRFYSYFKQSFQYYLADLCYYVNLLLMLFIWVFPNSPTLFVSVFSLTMGTLSFAVITWRNSLVLHLIEKTTSSVIHILPPVTMFVIVHEMPKDFLAERFPAVATTDKWNFINGIIWTSIYYTTWQVSYHYFITIKRKVEIDKGVVTSFTYLKKKQEKSPLGRLVNSLPYNWMQITAFTLIQFFYQILSMMFCPIWFKYKHACGAFMLLIFIWASYNGATYYVDVFGKRWEKEVAKLKAELDELQQKNERYELERINSPYFNSSPSSLKLASSTSVNGTVEDIKPLSLNNSDKDVIEEKVIAEQQAEAEPEATAVLT